MEYIKGKVVQISVDNSNIIGKLVNIVRVNTISNDNAITSNKLDDKLFYSIIIENAET